MAVAGRSLYRSLGRCGGGGTVTAKLELLLKEIILLFALQLQTRGGNDDLCLIDQCFDQPLSIC
jgi:hypothetical protein